MSSYGERENLTKIVEDAFPGLFLNDQCTTRKFGCELICGDNEELWKFISNEPRANQQAAAMIVKFAPDFILLKNSDHKELFFIDVKNSNTPQWSEKRLKELRTKNHDDSLTTDRIGVIAREALLAYRRYYPKSIVLMACPYNSKLLMAQFAEDIKCLQCYRSPDKEEYDCATCPWKTGGFFDIERDVKSDGSQTPPTTVDLDSFLSVTDFFSSKLGIQLNLENLDRLLQKIKQEPISINKGRVAPSIKNKTLWNINQAGCDWVDYEVYSVSGNDFYHLDSQCMFIKNKEKVVTYKRIEEALSDNKTKRCKKCWPEQD